MVEITGLFFALFAAIVWGSSFVPLKLAGKIDDFQYSSFVATGIFLSTLITMPILNFSLDLNSYGLVSGIMWSLGNVLNIIAVRLGGMSKVIPIIGAEIILLTFLWGVLFFNEQFSSITIATLGILFLILGVPLVVIGRERRSNSLGKAIAYSILAGIIGNPMVSPNKQTPLIS